MKRIPDVKVVTLALNARTVEGDAVLVERLVARMAGDGWAFASLATPSVYRALVAFTRPAKMGSRRSDPTE